MLKRGWKIGLSAVLLVGAIIILELNVFSLFFPESVNGQLSIWLDIMVAVILAVIVILWNLDHFKKLSSVRKEYKENHAEKHSGWRTALSIGFLVAAILIIQLDAFMYVFKPQRFGQLYVWLDIIFAVGIGYLVIHWNWLEIKKASDYYEKHMK